MPDHDRLFVLADAGRRSDLELPTLVAICRPCGIVRSMVLADPEMWMDFSGECVLSDPKAAAGMAPAASAPTADRRVRRARQRS